MCGWHTHVRVDWGWRRGAVWGSCGAGIVLGSSPAQADTGIADGVALHLVDCHLGGVALDELDEAAALSRRDLDVGDLTKALEEGAQFILGNVARKTANEDGGVVGVGKLVHRLRRTVEAHGRSATHGRRIHATWRTTSLHAHRSWPGTWPLVLRGRGGDAHGTVTAVNTLHFAKSTLLVILVGETDETIPTGHSTDGIGHDLSRLARREAALEQRDQNVFVDLRAEVSNEDGELRATVVTAVKQGKG